MKNDNERVKRAPMVDAQGGVSVQTTAYSFISQEELDRLAVNVPKEMAPFVYDLYNRLNQQFREKAIEEEGQKKLRDKDHENLRLALTAEFEKRISELEQRISALDVKMEQKFSVVEKRFSELQNSFNAQRVLLILTFLGIVLSGLGVLDKLRVLLGL